MQVRRRYLKRATELVVAVRLELETEGFTYLKWGHHQHCKKGDWIVNNHGDIYSVDAQSFERTYAQVSQGLYRKTAPVWAEQATSNGTVSTLEGTTQYRAGDYLVFNEENGVDAYAVNKEAFEKMYEPADN